MTSALDNLAMPGQAVRVRRLGDSARVALEAASAALLLAILVLLLGGVVWRYAFSQPLVWIDEVVSIAFLWFTMAGTAIAMQRHEHLRLTLFVDRLPPRAREHVHAFALAVVAACLVALVPPSLDYVRDEWLAASPSLGLPGSFRVAALPFGIAAMLVLLATHAARTVPVARLLGAVAAVAAIAAACWWARPLLPSLGALNVLVFLVGAVAVCLAAGVPIAFCFGIGALAYLGFSTHLPLQVVVGRMDEGMSSFILVSVPIFVLLGCVLDGTGMGKAIVDLLSGVVGHVKAGMSYALLGSLFIVSGISGSKVSDMATVAPALFPEMRRRGHQPEDMVALLATGAAMADTVPPSIVLIVLGSVAGVSIAGLFKSGFVVAMVLLLSLLVLARWQARGERTAGLRAGGPALLARLLLVASPALLLPFLIRGAVGEGIATATEVSTMSVLYALVVGQLLYGGIGRGTLYRMFVDTAALSGAIFLILGTASAMAWAVTQSGAVQQLAAVLTTLPGGPAAFMAVTVLVFVVLGCLLEGLPAVLLLAPIMFPMARQLGIHDVHYAMVMVVAMNIGLMVPPVGIGFYVACRIGNVSPDRVMARIWPYLLALLAGLAAIAAVPALSTAAL
jgi:tripartite ATP-independent transporter DctM subunit